MKVLLVCTSGGHFATMNGLKSFWSKHERVWVTDRNKDTEALVDKEKIYWLPYQPPRGILKLIANIPPTLRILRREKPDLMISTGASVSINFAFLAWVLGVRVVYIESISRFKELSLSGRLVYLIADEFYVQWPELCAKYPKAQFKGYAA